MKNIIMLILVLFAASCKKNTQAPTSTSQQSSQNSTASTTTLTTTEACLVGKWYFEKKESITNGEVISPVYNYTTAQNLNSMEFKDILNPVSSVENPNYKNREWVQNGAIFSTLVWKINDVGILSMNIMGAAPNAIIDSCTSTRLVYTEYTSLQPMNGNRYYLHK